MFEGSIESPTETYDVAGNSHRICANKENQALVLEKVILTQQSKQMQYQQTVATVGREQNYAFTTLPPSVSNGNCRDTLLLRSSRITSASKNWTQKICENLFFRSFV